VSQPKRNTYTEVRAGLTLNHEFKTTYQQQQLCNQLKLAILPIILLIVISLGGHMDIELKLIVVGGCVAGMGLMIAFMHLYKR
jgi:hypothetical protein